MKIKAMPGNGFPGLLPFTLGGLVLALIFFISACGYRFAGQGGLPFGIQRIHIPLLKNTSGVTGIETIFTNDLIYEFTRSSRASARLVKTEADADARFQGIIGPVTIRTITHQGHQVALERRVTVALSASIVSLEGKVLWSVKNLTDDEAYSVSKDKIATEYNKRAAIADISQRMAETIYNGFATHF